MDDPAFAASVGDKIEGLGLSARSAQDVIDEVNKLMVAVVSRSLLVRLWW